MKWLVSSACVFCVLFFTVYAAPASTSLQVSASGGGGGGLGSLLSNIDLPGLLQGVNSFVKLIGAFCPPLSQVLDNVIQNVTSTAFRVFGRAILRSGGLGGGNSGSGGGGSQRVNVVLPTFPPDEDYEDEDDSTTTLASANSLQNEVEAVTEAGVTLYTSPTSEVDDSANSISKRHVRVVREAEAEAPAAQDQEGAESAPQPGQDLADVDDQDRNKRYSPFGGGDGGHGGAGAGSGNFLFDIIRSTADRAARAVGTVYRMVAGTADDVSASSTSWNFAVPSLPDATKTLSTASSDLSARILPAKLVAGSGATEETDEHDAGAGGVAELDVQKDDHHEGIPGPITRLFVIANRGLANLIQDLILRLAQTSERLVNFKARLITALI
ncbi:putative lysozyme-like protein [Sitophilus oryzae]|uniref:Lysozyme-like protein n=1 Tax=Sitophilus oryzae TaxID=7048 RepID=A0A6J2YVC7_SITOR|nr:putative lysozyme-like protein [Sitophilus oryzae]